MRKIAHIVNPVKVNKDFDLYIAQPVTFKTMEIAREYSSDRVDVDFFSTQYPEDHEIVPKSLIKTADLTRSVMDIGEFKIKRKLPLIKDILNRLYDESNAEYFIYTNVDIGILPTFYQSVNSFIDSGYDGFVINRRTISKKYTSIDDITLMYSEVGESHKGFDCFIFRRDVFNNFNLGQLCLGAPWVGRVLLWNVVLNAEKFKEFQNLHLTFHIGDEVVWRDEKYSDYFIHNKNEAYRVLGKLKNWKPQSLEILDKHTYLRLFNIGKID